MNRRYHGDYDIEISSPEASWLLFGLTEDQVSAVAPRTEPTWDLVKDRILQRYIASCDYQVFFFSHTWGVSRGKGFVPARQMSAESTEVAGCWAGNEAIVDRYLGFVKREEVRSEFYNMSVIDVRGLKRWVLTVLPDLDRDLSRTVTLREAATKVWGRFGKNSTAMIQTWMRKTKPRGKDSGPIFCPVDLAAPGDPRGSRLDMSDVVTVGLIHWLLRHGVTYGHFEGPSQALTLGPR